MYWDVLSIGKEETRSRSSEEMQSHPLVHFPGFLLHFRPEYEQLWYVASNLIAQQRHSKCLLGRVVMVSWYQSSFWQEFLHYILFILFFFFLFWDQGNFIYILLPVNILTIIFLDDFLMLARGLPFFYFYLFWIGDVVAVQTLLGVITTLLVLFTLS